MSRGTALLLLAASYVLEGVAWLLGYSGWAP